jgi:hypothetical protein
MRTFQFTLGYGITPLRGYGRPSAVYPPCQKVGRSLKLVANKATTDSRLIHNHRRKPREKIASTRIGRKGQPVFLCCAGCEAAAKTDPAKTLATVKELKERGND